MNKQDRKRAVAAEVERRAKVSGVPVELQVYRFEKHHSDEGGPRCYVPVKISENLHSGDYDPTLWPRLLKAAFKEGTAIHVERDRSRMYRSGRTPIADLCEWGRAENALLMLSERANEALLPFLRRSCRPVPLRCTSAKVFGYIVKQSKDVLNAARCKAEWIDRGKRKIVSHMEAYSFYTQKLGRSALFRVPEERSRTFALQPVVDAVQAHGLMGYRFKRVWPHLSIPLEVKIPVKKLPAGAAAKPVAAALSTAFKKVAVDFLEELVGSPLVMDGKPPTALAGYQLPDMAIPSGVIVGVDLLLTEEKPFVRRVKPGSYPLTLVAAQKRSDERIAFAILRFGDRAVARWEAARIEGKKKSDAEGHCYGVESGCGGFCDAGAQEFLLDAEDPEGSQAKGFEKEMRKTYRHTREWLLVQTPKGGAAIFSAGYGDGAYPSYFGLDSKGQPVVLMTDFGVLEWPRKPIAGTDR